MRDSREWPDGSVRKPPSILQFNELSDAVPL